MWNPSTSTTKPTQVIPVHERVYALDYNSYFIAVGTANHASAVYDLRNVTQPVLVDETKDNIVSAISLCVSQQYSTLVTGYVEGLIRFKQPKVQAKEFRTQKNKEAGKDNYHAIEDMECHPNGFFVVGGFFPPHKRSFLHY